MKKFFYFNIIVFCFSVFATVSCASLQEVNIDTDSQIKEISDCERKFAELDAKFVSNNKLSTSIDFINECNNLKKLLKEGFSDVTNSKASKATFLALSGKIELLLGNVPLAKNFYNQSVAEYKGNVHSKILEFRLDSSVSLDSFNGTKEEEALISLEKAIYAFSNKNYVQAVANFDSAFISLPQYYKENFNALRNTAWSLRSLELNSSKTDNIELLSKEQITVADMLEITKSESNYFEKIFNSKIKSNSDFLKKVNDFKLLYPVSVFEKSSKLEREPAKENDILTKTLCARFLWNLYCNLEENPKIANKYSKIYRPKNKTPIPDVLTSNADFDACLGVIENEFMALEDGKYFFGSSKVSAMEFCSYLKKLK